MLLHLMAEPGLYSALHVDGTIDDGLPSCIRCLSQSDCHLKRECMRSERLKLVKRRIRRTIEELSLEQSREGDVARHDLINL